MSERLRLGVLMFQISHSKTELSVESPPLSKITSRGLRIIYIVAGLEPQTLKEGLKLGVSFLDHEPFITPIPTIPPQGGRRLRVLHPMAIDNSYWERYGNKKREIGNGI